jgi:hypothetical protein
VSDAPEPASRQQTPAHAQAPTWPSAPLRAPVRAVLGGFSPKRVPAISRRNYIRELTAAPFLPFLVAGVEVGVITVLVRKTFEGVPGVTPRELNIVVAVLGAVGALANISSFVWARASHGRPKVPFITGILISIMIPVVLVAVSPISAPGLYMVAGAVIIARMIWAGFVTVRSTVWRVNYARDVRARVTGRVAMVQVLSLGLLGAGLGAAMDYNPASFRILLPVGCAIGGIGIFLWSRVRVRGGNLLLREERDNSSADDAPSFNPVSMVRILRGDSLFASYMLCMFLLGLGNLMIPPISAIAVVEVFDVKYSGGILITQTIPLVLMPVSIPLWARLLDHVHVVKFRSIHAWAFIAAIALMLVGYRLEMMSLLYVAAVVQGLAFGGGVLAWNLGHMDFAPPHKASQYMAVHVTLTGVRGLIAPFLAVAVYESLNTWRDGAGTWVYALCLAIGFCGATGFVILARVMRERTIDHTQLEVAPPSRLDK